MSEFKFPTEQVELPSKGILYPETSPLSSGKIEIKYMMKMRRERTMIKKRWEEYIIEERKENWEVKKK